MVKRKLILGGLIVIIVMTFLEVFYYFMVYKNTGIPTISDLFSPTILSPYVKQAEETKTYYPQRLGDFTASFNPIVSSKSSFVKTAEANYVVGGTVAAISVIDNSNTAPGYDITLKNSKGGVFTERFSSVEKQFAKVFLRTPTSFDISRSAKSFTDIKIGDYLVIKRSFNLLNSEEVNIDLEILTN